MLEALTLLLACQLAGEVLVRLIELPVPGPVLGMGLLFAGLAWRGDVPEPLERTCQGLLEHLSLLFVPAGVGIMVHFARISGEWLPILAAVLVSTALAIAVSALVMRALMRGRSDSDEPETGT